MIAKLVIVSLFAMLGTLLGNICCTAFIIFRDKYWNIVQGSFQMQDLKEIVSLTIMGMAIDGILIGVTSYVLNTQISAIDSAT